MRGWHSVNGVGRGRAVLASPSTPTEDGSPGEGDGKGRPMLDAYIIDAIHQEERARRERARGRIWLELPVDNHKDEPGESEPQDHGPIVIPLDRSIPEEDAA